MTRRPPQRGPAAHAVEYSDLRAWASRESRPIPLRNRILEKLGLLVMAVTLGLGVVLVVRPEVLTNLLAQASASPEGR